MTNNPVIIAGGGIGGLATALTLHQIGVPCIVFEAVREMRPLGVGINLQPNAVRELYDLGITKDDLDRVGLPAKEWALVGLNGNDIYSEPRGLLAGYNWPQYAVHRGRFHMLLYDKVVERTGPRRGAARQPRHRLPQERRRRRHRAGRACRRLDRRGERRAADRRRRHPLGGAGADAPRPAADPLGRRDHVARHHLGASRSAPARPSSASAPIATAWCSIRSRSPTRQTGLAMINWIAEVTMDNGEGWKQSGWFRQVEIDEFAHHFDGWTWDWLDVPALIRRRRQRLREPDDRPRPGADLAGRPGGAARRRRARHVSDRLQRRQPGDRRCARARRRMVEHGVTPAALAAYDAKLCGPISQLVLRNRGAGPFGLLNMVDERCGGTFDNIDDVIPPEERAEFMAGYKAAAGFAIEALNKAERTIKEGALERRPSGPLKWQSLQLQPQHRSRANSTPQAPSPRLASAAWFPFLAHSIFDHM